ncbi:hypothetical protein BJV82DRAFT_589441 [Fennellomyces sp. T-0311]|nr:hypothetical protein BJV82DRAFT_589441 [Fennellomyces sp. T-0311]
MNSEIKRLVDEKMEAQKRAIHHVGKTEEAAETLKMIKAEHAVIAEKLRKSVESLQQENDGLRKELLQVQHENEDLQQAKGNVDDQYTVQIEDYRNQVQILKLTEEQYAQQINEAREQIIQLTDELTKAQTAANEKAEGSESRLLADLTEQYKRQCDLVKETEVANQILKEELNYYKANYPDYERILNEKLSLQRENEQAKRLQVAYRQLQEENERLQNERKQWSQFLESGASGELNTPRDVIYRLESESRKIKESELQVKELKERLQYSESRGTELNTKIDESNAKISQLEELVKTYQVDKESLEQEKDMIVMHRDLLEAQLTSMFKLEEEATTNNDEFPLTQRISELHSLLKKYQDDLSMTKHRLILERSQSTTQQETGRVLELKRSPSRLSEESRTQELERLRQENRALLDEIQNLQSEGYSDAAGLGEKRKREAGEASSTEQDTVKVPTITLDNFRTQIRELQDTIIRKEKRIDRLHTVFKSKFDGMTNCVRDMLGYVLEFPAAGVEPVRIKSTFVDSSDFAFVYLHDEDDQAKIRIVGKNKMDYMQVLQGTYDTFITEQQNIPGFLSSVTLELMNGESDDTAVYSGYAGTGLEEEEYDEEQYSEEYDDMNDTSYDDGPGGNHDEPITIDDDDDDDDD